MEKVAKYVVWNIYLLKFSPSKCRIAIQIKHSESNFKAVTWFYNLTLTKVSKRKMYKILVMDTDKNWKTALGLEETNLNQPGFS
jgi:hypothetical protein